MWRFAHVAGWLAAANLGVSLILLAAIAGFVEWWAAPLAVGGVAVVGVAVTGLAVETRRALVDRARRRERHAGRAALSAPPAEPSGLTPVRMDLGRRPDASSRKKAQPPVRR